MLFIKKQFKFKVLYFILCIFSVIWFSGIGAAAESSTYNIKLPQKIDGIEKIEYFVNDVPYGSTSGISSVDLPQNSEIYFSVKFEASGYNQTKVKDIKILSNNNDPLYLNTYGYDESQEITRIQPSEDATIDPDETYITSSAWIFSNDAFSFNNLEKDKFDVLISLGDNDQIINDSLEIKYLYNNSEFSYASFDSETNSLKIPDVPLNTSLKLWINPTSAYSNSLINVYKSDEKLIPDENDNTFSIFIDNSDAYVEIEGIKKNEYNLNFISEESTSFKLKNKNSDDNFTIPPGNSIKINHGESYYFTCSSSILDDNHEVTVNGIVLKAENGVYSLNDIKENLTITLTEKNSAIYSVSLSDVTSIFDITDSQSNPISEGLVKYSEPFNFKTSVKEAYTQKEHQIRLYAVPASIADSENLEKQLEEYRIIRSIEGTYTIPSVTEPMKIIARNAEKNSYIITLPEKIVGGSYKVAENEYSTALSENQFQVTHGESLEVSLFSETGYDASNAELLTDNQSAEISKDGTVYKLNNITSDTYLVVNDMETTKFKVTLEGEGIIFKNLENIPFNSSEIFVDSNSDSLKFRTELSEGYKLTNSSLTASISEGEAQLSYPSGESDYYVLSNVRSNIKLSITGAEPITFTITLPSEDKNLTFKDASDKNSPEDSKELPKKISVKYGENFEFKVECKNKKESLEKFRIIPSTDAEVIRISEDYSKYLVKNIYSDTELKVSQVNKDINDSLRRVVWLPAKILRVTTSDNSKLTYRMKLKPEVDYPNVDANNDEAFWIKLGESHMGNERLHFRTLDKYPYAVSSLSRRAYFKNDANSDYSTRGDGHLNYYYTSGDSAKKMIIFQDEYYKHSENFKNTQPAEVEEIGQTICKYLYYEIKYRVSPNARIPICNIKFDKNENYKYHRVKNYNGLSNGIADVDIGEEIINNTNDEPQRFGNDNGIYFVLEVNEAYNYGSLNITSPDKYSDNTKNPGAVGKNTKLKKIGKVKGTDNKYLYRIIDIDAENLNIKTDGLVKKKYEIDFNKSTKSKFYFGGDEKLKETVEHGNSLKFSTKTQDEKKFETLESSAKIEYIDKKTGKTETFDLKIQEFVDNNRSEQVYIKGNSNKDLSLPESIPIDKITINRNFDNTLSYELSNIKDNFNVIIKRDLITHNITFPEIPSIQFYKINDIGFEEPLKGNIQTNQENFHFRIKVDKQYDETKVKIKANDEELTSTDNYYTINFTKLDSNDAKIEVDNNSLSPLKYSVLLAEYEDIKYKIASNQSLIDENKVELEYGKDLQFSVSVLGAHSESKISVKAKSINSGEIQNLEKDKKTGLYTLKDIKENYRIYIDGIEINKYNIKFKFSDKISYYDQYGIENLNDNNQNPDSEFINKTVNYGETFKFKIVGNEGVDISEINVWYSRSSSSIQNSIRLFPINDVYSIENITNDVILYVGDTKSISYQVEIRTTEGVRCLDSYGNILESQISVDHGKNLSFSLALDPAYNNASPIVSIKGSTNVLSPSSDGIYTLENIKENKIIEVTNVTKNTYKIKFKEKEGVIYRTIKNKPFTEYLDAEYGNVQQFKISLMDAYDQSSPIVLLNNSKILTSNGGIYTIENVGDNLEVTVENVVKNPEETTMEDINDVPESIVSSSDVDKVVAATKTYESLPEDQKFLVTNTQGLTAAQENAKIINHTSNNVTVTGIDWNIKLVVTPLTDNKEAMESLNSEIDRRTLLSLYEMKLRNLITNEDYEVPYGQEVSVTMPCSDFKEYENIVVVHKNSGGGLEYLDININENIAQFKTSSFSQFGIAGKKIPNYSENPSDIKISVSDLVENEDELKNLLGEGLTSQLGELINIEESNPTSEIENDTSSEIDNNSVTDSKINKIYKWILNNELTSVIIVIAVGTLIILLILLIGKKKDTNES